EAAVLERLDALGQNVVRHLDALIAVDLAQARNQLALATLVVELAANQVLAMAQRVHNVHRDHDVVELLRLARRERGLGHLRLLPGCRYAAEGSVSAAAISLAMRFLPSSTASRISAEFWVESLRISMMISAERSWKPTTLSTSFLTASARMVGP